MAGVMSEAVLISKVVTVTIFMNLVAQSWGNSKSVPIGRAFSKCHIIFATGHKKTPDIRAYYRHLRKF